MYSLVRKLAYCTPEHIRTLRYQRRLLNRNSKISSVVIAITQTKETSTTYHFFCYWSFFCVTFVEAMFYQSYQSSRLQDGGQTGYCKVQVQDRVQQPRVLSLSLSLSPVIVQATRQSASRIYVQYNRANATLECTASIINSDYLLQGRHAYHVVDQTINVYDQHVGTKS